MAKNSKIMLERKSGEGCVIETPFGNFEIVVIKKDNGRISIRLQIPDMVNLYRIDVHGKPQNKKVKDFVHDRPNQENKTRPIQHTKKQT